MNHKPIMDNLIQQINGMYPQFTYKMSYSEYSKNYVLAIGRNGFLLRTLVLFADTPMTDTLDLIKECMSNLIKGLR